MLLAGAIMYAGYMFVLMVAHALSNKLDRPKI